MKKLITALMVSLFALSVYAANNEKLAEVVGIEYGSMILEVENNDLKVNDKVVIKPAGSMQGKVTEVKNSLITLAVDNNGFAEGSKIFIKKGRERFSEKAKK